MAMYAKSAGGNWSAAGTWSATSASGVDSVGPPTAATDVIFELLSGAVTVDVASVCRSLDTTSGVGTYGGTLTHNAFTLSIGDGTAGAGSVALKLNSGMTYSLSNSTTSAISFVSTSATQQTITWGTKTPGNVTFVGVSGSWILQDTWTAAATTVTLTSGAIDTNSQTLSLFAITISGALTRSMTLGTSTVNLASTGNAWNSTTSTNLTFSGASSTINCTGATASFIGGTRTYGTITITGSGACVAQSAFICANFTRTGTASQTDSLSINTGFTATTALTFNGNSTSNRLRVVSGTAGTQTTLTLTGATVTGQYFNLTDIAASGATPNISAVTGGSGDGGNNSGFTFTTPVTNYWVAGTGTWTDNTNHWASASGGTAGTGRIPLLQDTARFDGSSFSAGGQNVSGMLQQFGHVDWTGATNSPAWTISGVLSNVWSTFGSITLISSMTLSLGASNGNFLGRGANTLTSAGKSWTGLTTNCFAGSMAMQDAATLTGNFTLTTGTFTTNSFNMSISAFVSTGTGTRTFNQGTTNLTVNLAAATIWNATSTGITFNGTTGTITIPSSASNQAFNGGGITTYGTLAVAGGGAGQITISGFNTWSNLFQVTGGTKTMLFTAGTIQTFTGGTNFGNGTNVVTFNSASTPTQFAFFNVTIGFIISADYLSLKDSQAIAGGATWYAGANSTNTSNNTNWIFTAPPSGGGNFFFSS